MAVTPTSLPTNITALSNGLLTNTNTAHTAINEVTKAVYGTALNLRAQPGVVGDGVTDDAAAINTALASAASLGVRLYATGTFKIGSTVTITSDADLSGATFNYTAASGIAVQVGGASVLYRKTINLPTIIAAAKTALGWAQVAGTTGLKILNGQYCRISTPRVANFEVGLLVRGEGTGCAYNQVNVGMLDNNKINHDISADATGWSNENHYSISKFSFESAEGASVSGTRDIRIQTAANLPNNNVWWGGSVEANTPEYHLECHGAENRFLHMRWENSGGCRVYWRVGAFRNVIDYGYSAHLIVQTYEAGAIGQSVLTASGWKLVQNSVPNGVLQIENGSGSAYPALTVMAAGAAVAGDNPATAYAGVIGANTWALKRNTESFDRLQLDGQNSRVYFGSGAATIVRYLANLGTTAISVNGGNFVAGADNTLDLGVASFRWRYIRCGTAVVTGAAVTGSRPSASTAGVGAMFYDTTLSRPIWSDGTTWRDSAGTSV